MVCNLFPVILFNKKKMAQNTEGDSYNLKLQIRFID